MKYANENPTPEELSLLMEEVKLGATLTFTKEEDTSSSSHYYLIPSLSLALPMGKHAHAQLSEELVSRGNYDLPDDLGEYPIVTSYHLHRHFSSYVVLTKKTKVTVTRFTPDCELRRQERAKKEAAKQKYGRLRKAAGVVTVPILLNI